MNRQGPVQQGMRGIANFSNQPPQNRPNAMGGGRLPNGNAGNWGFGGVAPQNRGANTNSQALDPSEFPSLSAGVPQSLPQAHHQNAGQTAWANQRASQPTPVQRPQQGPGNASQQNNQAQEAVQQTLEDAFFPASQYSSNQQGNDHPSTFSQSSSIDEFPPLGRSTHGEIGQDRRGSLAPTSGFRGFPSNPSSAFGQQSSYMPTRASELGDAPGLERRAFPGRDGGFGVASRSPMPGQNGTGPNDTITDSSRIINLRRNSIDREDSFLQSFERNQKTITPSAISNVNAFGAPGQAKDFQSRPSQTQQHFTDNFGLPTNRTESPLGISNGTGSDIKTQGSGDRQTPLEEMKASARYGLPGFVGQLRSNNPDVRALAIGQDLTTLGLNLNSAEPLWPTFAGPFANGPTHPATPAYTLPACYKVLNIHPLEEKIGSFSDETLFYIFYTMVRDIVQELAAVELTHRNWRYNKTTMQWLTKDPNFGDPIAVSHEAERGRYVVFNEKAWQRERREMVLRWGDLDDHIPVRQGGGQAFPGLGGMGVHANL